MIKLLGALGPLHLFDRRGESIIMFIKIDKMHIFGVFYRHYAAFSEFLLLVNVANSLNSVSG